MSETTAAPSGELENTIYMDIPRGRVVIQLFPDVAPGHVERFKTLARKGSTTTLRSIA